MNRNACYKQSFQFSMKNVCIFEAVFNLNFKNTMSNLGFLQIKEGWWTFSIWCFNGRTKARYRWLALGDDKQNTPKFKL